jgi:hypothetical protein
MRIRKPSPATIIASLALLLALGGSAVAANRYVITSTSQIKPSVLAAVATPPGPDVLIHGPVQKVAPGQFRLLTARCPSGDHVVTGGYAAELVPGASVTADMPSGTGGGWLVTIDNKSSLVIPALAHALCAPGRITVLPNSWTLESAHP